MSTKALNTLMDAVRYDKPVTFAMRADAQRELEAIERAAKAFHEDLDPRVMSHAPASLHAALDTLTDIAKDAP